ncbi:MAG: hypothetical protein KQA40_02175 [Candidatus Aenigmarchaeota archaeon]|nr:hypothetical protein [Candidatus Aenigmarchaeota archaeon]
MNKKKPHLNTYLIFGILLLILIYLSFSIFAGIPQQITLQGRLADKTGFPIPKGFYTFGFSIYDAPEKGNLLWSETQENIYVDENGIVNIILGKNNPINLNWDKPYYLEINFTSRQMRTVEVFKPRYNITSAGYAFSSKNLMPTNYPVVVLATNVLTAISGIYRGNQKGIGVYGEGYYGLYGNATLSENYGLYVERGKSYFGGNVGIGIANPQQALDVRGNVNITENLTVGGYTDIGYINAYIICYYEKMYCVKSRNDVSGNAIYDIDRITGYCPDGYKILSGGCTFVNNGNLINSAPLGENGWVCDWNNTSNKHSMYIYLICAKIK